MSTSASSLNWWCIDGSRRTISSAGMRDAMSRYTPPWGVERPALTSELMARATSSRGNRSGVRRLLSGSSYHLSASSAVSAYWPLNTAGMYENMKRSPSEFLSTPPSPRTPSVTRMPLTLGGHTIPVGWNCTNSMLIRFAPARSASACPSPVYSHELEVTLNDLPMPPVAITTAGASNSTNRPDSRQYPKAPAIRSPSLSSSVTVHSANTLTRAS